MTTAAAADAAGRSERASIEPEVRFPSDRGVTRFAVPLSPLSSRCLDVDRPAEGENPARSPETILFRCCPLPARQTRSCTAPGAI